MASIYRMGSEHLIKLYVRTTERLRAELKRLVADVGAHQPFVSRRYVVTQETFLNAVWMMLRDEDPAELARRLAPYVARTESAMDVAPEPLPKAPAQDDDQPQTCGQILEVKDVTGQGLFEQGEEVPVKRVERKQRPAGNPPKRRKGAG